MQDRYIKLLQQLISHKSISTDQAFADEINATSDWLKELFEKHDFETQIINGYENPIVLAEYSADTADETCLIYGHYDVQPAKQEDGWGSDPFELNKRDGRLFARGAVDNKGQVMIHMATVFGLIEKNKLGYNIKFLLEGNEETGSAKLPAFLKDHADSLDANCVLISDGEITSDHPIIERGFRGVANIELDLKTAEKEVHSGLYGGAVPNAAHELSLLISDLFEEDYTLKESKMYENTEVSDSVRENHQQIPFSADAIKKRTGIQELLINDADFYTQISCKPTVQVTGISSGYTGEGFRNSIPNKAIAKINIRTAPKQDPEKIAGVLSKYIKENAPEYTTITISTEQSSPGVALNTNNSYADRAKEILADVFENQVFEQVCGGTIPIVARIQEILDVPQILVPLANEDCNMHAVDENYRIDLIEKGLEFSRQFFSSK